MHMRIREEEEKGKRKRWMSEREEGIGEDVAEGHTGTVKLKDWFNMLLTKTCVCVCVSV